MSDDPVPILHRLTLDAPGRQHGQMAFGGTQKLPDRQRVPVICMRRGEGPTALLISGASGRETTGPLVLDRLARTLELERLQGRILIVPDLSGTKPNTGSYEAVRALLLPAVDLLIDLRAALPMLHCEPFASSPKLVDPVQAACANSAMVAFGASNSLPDCDTAGHLLAGPALPDRHMAAISVHLGDGSPATADRVQAAMNGCLNVLIRMGVYSDVFQLSSSRTLQLAGRQALLRSEIAGRLELHRSRAQDIYPTGPVATVHSLDEFGPSQDICSGRAGMLLAHRAGDRVDPGDCVAVVADDIRP